MRSGPRPPAGITWEEMGVAMPSERVAPMPDDDFADDAPQPRPERREHAGDEPIEPEEHETRLVVLREMQGRCGSRADLIERARATRSDFWPDTPSGARKLRRDVDRIDDARATVERVVLIALAELVDSPLRKRRDDGGLDELAASMRARGVLQPLVVRARRGRFEVVIGARRFHAAPLAGLTELPCIVREMSDDEVLAAFIVSKLQRQNLHVLDEAEAFHELRATHGWSVARIAKDVGTSQPKVYSRLKLRELAPVPWEALVDGRLPTQLAIVIARIAAPDLQNKATREVLRSDAKGATPMVFVDAVEHIRRTYMLTAVGDALKPGDLFDCAVLRCRLAAAACVARQDARSGKMKSTWPKHRMCGAAIEGEPSPCEQGRGVRAALGAEVQAPRPKASPFSFGAKVAHQSALPAQRAPIDVTAPESPPAAPLEEQAAIDVTSEPEEPLVPLRTPRAKQPSRQTRDWLTFTETHGLAAVLDDPMFWGLQVLEVVEPMPFDSAGQRFAACLAAGVSLAMAEDVARSQVRRLVDELFVMFARDARERES